MTGHRTFFTFSLSWSLALEKPLDTDTRDILLNQNASRYSGQNSLINRQRLNLTPPDCQQPDSYQDQSRG
jgi:hypothetical protein